MRASGIISTALLIGFSFFPVWNGALAQNIIYVDQSAAGSDDGSSWTDAFNSLQDALAVLQPGDEVWVAAGSYRPDEGVGIAPGDRTATFEIPGGVSVYGGFDGSELALDGRDWEAYETILSGDLLENDDDLLSFDNPLRLDNSYRIVEIEQSAAPVALDGLTIRDGMAATEDGYASASGIRMGGPSVYPSEFPFFQISNCRFTSNVALTGTIQIGARLDQFEPIVTIEDTIFERNYGSGTAGIEVISGTTLIRNVLFANNQSNHHTVIDVGKARVYVSGSTIRDNRTVSDGVVNVGGADEEDDSFLYIWDSIIAGNEGGCCGAGIRVKEAELISINNVITGNTVSFGGGAAIYAIESTALLINNVIAFNSAPDGGAVESTISSVSIANSIFWQNTAAGHPDFYSARPDTSTINVAHSVASGPFPSYVTNQGGNIASDPFFLDPDGADDTPGTADDDFRLMAFSLAIDAGANELLYTDVFDLDSDMDTAEFWSTDFLGNLRVFDGGAGSALVDMGVFEFGAPPVALSRFSEDTDWLATELLTVYPNPIKDRFTVTWHHNPVANGVLELIDLSGRSVRRKFIGDIRSPDQINVTISGVAAGVYLLREMETGVSTTVVIVN